MTELCAKTWQSSNRKVAGSGAKVSASRNKIFNTRVKSIYPTGLEAYGSKGCINPHPQNLGKNCQNREPTALHLEK
jgi:hypothetical protein